MSAAEADQSASSAVTNESVQSVTSSPLPWQHSLDTSTSVQDIMKVHSHIHELAELSPERQNHTTFLASTLDSSPTGGTVPHAKAPLLAGFSLSSAPSDDSIYLIQQHTNELLAQLKPQNAPTTPHRGLHPASTLIENTAVSPQLNGSIPTQSPGESTFVPTFSPHPPNLDGSHAVHNEPSLFSENTLLRQSVERERLRRKTCEKKIQGLHEKLLSTQQQLAMAVALQRKRDLTLQQLDKSMLQIAESWRQREAEHQAASEKLQHMNSQLEQKLTPLKEVVDQKEDELRRLRATLDEECQRRQEAERAQNEMLQRHSSEHSQTLQQLSQERQHTTRLESEQARLENSIRTLLREKEEAEAGALQAVSAAKKQFEEEHHATEEAKAQLERTIKNLEEQVQIAQHAVQTACAEVDLLKQEKENLKVEHSLQVAQLEAHCSRLETHYKAELERQLAMKTSELQESGILRETQLREHHRVTMLQLQEQHSDQLKQHQHQHQQDLEQKEAHHWSACQEYEQQIQGLESRLGEATASKQSLITQRSTLTAQLQAMLRQHCNEALLLLSTSAPFVSSPERTGDFLSTAEKQSPEHSVHEVSVSTNFGRTKDSSPQLLPKSAQRGSPPFATLPKHLSPYRLGYISDVISPAKGSPSKELSSSMMLHSNTMSSTANDDLNSPDSQSSGSPSTTNLINDGKHIEHQQPLFVPAVYSTHTSTEPVTTALTKPSPSVPPLGHASVKESEGGFGRQLELLSYLQQLRNEAMNMSQHGLPDALLHTNVLSQATSTSLTAASTALFVNQTRSPATHESVEESQAQSTDLQAKTFPDQLPHGSHLSISKSSNESGRVSPSQLREVDRLMRMRATMPTTQLPPNPVKTSPTLSRRSHGKSPRSIKQSPQSVLSREHFSSLQREPASSVAEEEQLVNGTVRTSQVNGDTDESPQTNGLLDHQLGQVGRVELGKDTFMSGNGMLTSHDRQATHTMPAEPSLASTHVVWTSNGRPYSHTGRVTSPLVSSEHGKIAPSLTTIRPGNLPNMQTVRPNINALASVGETVGEEHSVDLPSRADQVEMKNERLQQPTLSSGTTLKSSVLSKKPIVSRTSEGGIPRRDPSNTGSPAQSVRSTQAKRSLGKSFDKLSKEKAPLSDVSGRKKKQSPAALTSKKS